MDNQLFRDIQTDLDLNGPILSFSTQPTSLQVAGVGPGQTGGPTATFTAVATVSFPGDSSPANTGTIAYQWYGPLGVLTEGTKYVGTKTTTLQITNVISPTDVGSYYVVVDYVPSTQTGNAINEPLTSNSAALTSFPVIEINAQPTPFINIPSTDSNFNIDASLSDNGTDLSYQWQLDGEDVNDGTVTKSTIEQVPGTTDYRVTSSGVIGHMRSFDIPTGAKEVMFELAGGAGGSGGGNYPDGMGTAGRGGYGMQGWFRLASRHYLGDDFSQGLMHVVHVDLIAGGKGSDGVVGSRDPAPGGENNLGGQGGPGGPAGWGANGGEQSSGDAGGGGGGGAASYIQVDGNIAIVAGGGGGGGGAWFGNTAGGDGQNGRDAGPQRSAAQNADGRFNPLTLEWDPNMPSVHEGNNGAGGHNGQGTDTPGGGGGGGGKNGGPGGWHGHRPNGADAGHEGSSAYRPGDVDYRSGSYNTNSDGYAFVHYLVSGQPTLIDQNVTRTTTISGSSTSQLTLNTDGPGIGYTVRCNLTSSSASNSPYTSDVVDYHVESTVESADIVVEGIGLNLSTASVSTIDLSNGELSLDTIGKGFVGTAPTIQLYSLYAPDRDVDIEMDLYGGKGEDIQFGGNGGEGGFARIRFTMKRNEEYVIAGLTDNVNTPFLYRKSTLMACVGGGGGASLPQGHHGHGGDGGGIGIAGGNGVGGQRGVGGNAIATGALGVNGIFGSSYIAPTLYPGDTQAQDTRGDGFGGQTIRCTKGVYYAQQGVAPCADVADTGQFRLPDGTAVTNTANINRGYKAGYNIIQTGGRWTNNSNGVGGNGATGGDGGFSDSAGGGGSGYTDGSVTVVSTTQGGSTGDAKVVIRVVT